MEVSGNADGEPAGDGAVAGDADGLGLIMPPPPMTTRERMGVTGPFFSCYLHAGGRSVGRIIRGKPRGSVSMQCYFRPSCKFVIAERMGPGDDSLIDWLYEMPAPLDTAFTLERKAAALAHMLLAQKWRATGSGAAASSAVFAAPAAA